MRWYGRDIDPDGEYFVYFPDRKREMTDRELREYRAVKRLPECDASMRLLANLDPRLNPNVTPMKGRALMRLAEETGCVPQFDLWFERSGRVTLTPIQGVKFWRGR